MFAHLVIQHQAPHPEALATTGDPLLPLSGAIVAGKVITVGRGRTKPVSRVKRRRQVSDVRRKPLGADVIAYLEGLRENSLGSLSTLLSSTVKVLWHA
jgi:hypothetical protein